MTTPLISFFGSYQLNQHKWQTRLDAFDGVNSGTLPLHALSPPPPHHTSKPFAPHLPICKTPGLAPLEITPSHHAQSSTKMALAVTQHVWARTTTTVTGQGAEDHTLEGLAQNMDKYFNPLPKRAQTPVQINRLQIELSQHPGPVFVNNLIHDMTFGFNIGYKGPRRKHICHNLRSAIENPTAAGESILKELKQQHLAGPFRLLLLPNLQISLIGPVPKKGGSDTRLIMDLSFPKGDAINDYIDPDDCTIKFDSFDRAIEMVSKLGKGAQLEKLDIKSAYHICPVRKEDWDLSGIMWEGRIFIDLCLAFGLRPAGNRFNRLADALCWLLSNNHAIENLMHYLDEFFLANEADSDNCRL